MESSKFLKWCRKYQDAVEFFAVPLTLLILAAVGKIGLLMLAAFLVGLQSTNDICYALVR